MRTKHELILAEYDPVARATLQLDEKPWYIPPETRYMLLQQAKYRCAICKRQYQPSLLHIDHRVPVALGGKCHLDNLEVLCYSCNTKKGAHILDPASYSRGYPIPIYVRSERDIAGEILERVEDEYA